MKTNLFPLLVLSTLVYCPVAFTQTAVDRVTGEQIIEIQVTPSDFAAAGKGHHWVHTAGAQRPEGGRKAPQSFQTDSSGALLAITGKSQALVRTAAAAAAPQVSTGAPPFPGAGFYPADLSLLTTTGQEVTQAQVHNIYINCDASCWGYPAVFERNLFSSRFIHVVDQYVGSGPSGRYTVGPSLVINNYPIPSQLVTNPLLNFADLDTILHAAASKLGSGYKHIFSIFIPKGVDICLGYAPPYTSCFSPDNLAAWNFCGFHGSDSFTDIPGAEYATVQGYPDVSATDSNGSPVYFCDVGQLPPLSSNTNPTPNGVLVDSVSATLAHEIFETITDPDTSEWQALSTYYFAVELPVTEISDLCEQATDVFTPFYVSGHLYEIEPKYSNKYHACVTVP